MVNENNYFPSESSKLENILIIISALSFTLFISTFFFFYEQNNIDVVNFCQQKSYSIYDWSNCTSIGTQCWYKGNATARDIYFNISYELNDILIQNGEDSTIRQNNNGTIIGLDLKELYDIEILNKRTGKEFEKVECPIERCSGKRFDFNYTTGFLNETRLFNFNKVCCNRNETSKDCFSKIITWKITEQ